MHRRDFLVLGSVVGFSTYLHATPPTSEESAFESVKRVIEAVQAVMFPHGGKLPSAKAMETIVFTQETLFHPSYDRDIRAFVIGGAKELDRREKGKFLSYTSHQQEQAMRRFEETTYGSNWLGRIMLLTMEALFSDPIYGSNIKEAGWKALQTQGGVPRPTTRYLAL